MQLIQLDLVLAVKFSHILHPTRKVIKVKVNDTLCTLQTPDNLNEKTF